MATTPAADIESRAADLLEKWYWEAEASFLNILELSEPGRQVSVAHLVLGAAEVFRTSLYEVDEHKPGQNLGLADLAVNLARVRVQDAIQAFIDHGHRQAEPAAPQPPPPRAVEQKPCRRCGSEARIEDAAQCAQCGAWPLCETCGKEKEFGICDCNTKPFPYAICGRCGARRKPKSDYCLRCGAP